MMQRPPFDFSAPETSSTSAREPIQPGQYRGPKSDRRPNRYGGKCVKCGQRVGEEEGWLTGSAGNWGVEHKDGQCPTTDQVAPAADPTRDRTGAAAKGGWDVPDGRYTINWGDHHKTVKVSTQDVYADFMPGLQVLAHLTGSDNDSDYTRFGHVDEDGNVRIWRKFAGVANLREAVKVLMGDPKAASKAYAQQSGECGVCGRTLTTPESIEYGIGPECRKRVGW